ncbi:(Fe-S)-binding protein [Hanamia caeni]|uniref:(Fe-S)-binding protein n=2 Tax=Hanamia caeni TaxID=2294116 RepID=A0A3M9NRK4_9BACT|nr:(Fe-S)-binding protein [Hanamia caeni]
MQMFQQIAFILLVAFAIFLFGRKVKEIKSNINLGKEQDISDHKAERWKTMLLLAFGQKKMFRYPLVAVLHFIIYAGFIIINIEILEIVLDGLLGTHRLFAATLGGFYTFVIDFFEILAVGVLVSCVVFLIRRNMLKLKRFIDNDLDGWPRTDANLILITEIILMGLFLTMNAADRALQLQGNPHYADHGSFIFSGWLSLFLVSIRPSTLVGIERTCWWLHITGIFAFLNYLPYSKHFHILLAFPNTYYKRLIPKGEMINMKNVEQEVHYMFEPELATANGDAQTQTQSFGARDIFDLTWKNLMDAYTCTECGRCTAACPAHQTGKLLSPRKIMMDTRDRMQDVRKNIKLNGSFKNDEKPLLHNYITAEELRACTSCNACVQECPVGINPLDIIFSLRRALIMEESNAPAEWNAMFSNIENNFAPWKFSPDDRDKWATEME